MEIRHEPYWYEKEQLPYLRSIQIIFFDEVHIQQVSGPTMTNKYISQEMKKLTLMLKTDKYDTNNQQKKATFKYELEGRFGLGVAKIEIKNGTITGKRCPVFDYIGKKIVKIDAYKKEILKEFARV